MSTKNDIEIPNLADLGGYANKQPRGFVYSELASIFNPIMHCKLAW
jgi:hypothetical protein